MLLQTHKILYFFLLISFILAAACAKTKAVSTIKADVTKPVVMAPKTNPEFISWDKKKIDLGSVKKGEKRDFFYEFTNTSGADIQIDIVDACECTTVDFPRGVIPPNGKKRITASFDSTSKDADETIGITIVFKNTDEQGNPRIASLEYSFVLLK